MARNYVLNTVSYYDDLYNIALEVKNNAKIVLNDEKEVINSLQNTFEDDDDIEQIFIAKQIEEDSNKVVKLGYKIERLYDDWLAKKINETNFQRILEKMQDEQNRLLEKISELKKRLVVDEIKEVNIYNWIELIKNMKK